MKLLLYISTICVLLSCNEGKTSVQDDSADSCVCVAEQLVERIDTNGLVVLYPHYGSIDLVCDSMPSKKDDRVILFAEAAFTGQCLKVFDHFNVAGDHVSGGKRYKGYRCKRNTGAFVFYDNKWKFCHLNYSHELDVAAKHGGAAFAQELIIFKGKAVKTVRKDGNRNQFRALCEQDGRLCIVESHGVIPFGDFRQRLLDLGVTHALYLDMGAGWTHAWYRDGNRIVELHPKHHSYCTNWITFFR